MLYSRLLYNIGLTIDVTQALKDYNAPYNWRHAYRKRSWRRVPRRERRQAFLNAVLGQGQGMTKEGMIRESTIKEEDQG